MEEREPQSLGESLGRPHEPPCSVSVEEDGNLGVVRERVDLTTLVSEEDPCEGIAEPPRMPQSLPQLGQARVPGCGSVALRRCYCRLKVTLELQEVNLEPPQ